MFNLPNNPYSQHPERSKTVQTRIAVVLGSTVTAAVSTYEMYKLPALDLRREYLQFTTMASCLIGSMPVFAELQERYRRFGNGGGGGGGWFVPDFPDVPPNGGNTIPTPSPETTSV